MQSRSHSFSGKANSNQTDRKIAQRRDPVLPVSRPRTEPAWAGKVTPKKGSYCHLQSGEKRCTKTNVTKQQLNITMAMAGWEHRWNGNWEGWLWKEKMQETFVAHRAELGTFQRGLPWACEHQTQSAREIPFDSVQTHKLKTLRANPPGPPNKIQFHY